MVRGCSPEERLYKLRKDLSGCVWDLEKLTHDGEDAVFQESYDGRLSVQIEEIQQSDPVTTNIRSERLQQTRGRHDMGSL